MDVLDVRFMGGSDSHSFPYKPTVRIVCILQRPKSRRREKSPPPKIQSYILETVDSHWYDTVCTCWKLVTALERWSPSEVNTEQEEENLGSAWDKWDFLHREGS